MLIGELSRQTGCKPETIRYYEKRGLLPAPERTSGRYRNYGPTHRERLNFILGARSLGFSLEETKELIGLSTQRHRSCRAVDAIAQRHLEQVRARIDRLQSLARELERIIESCAGGQMPACRILEAMPTINRPAEA